MAAGLKGILELLGGAYLATEGIVAMAVPGMQGLGMLLINAGVGLALSGIGTLVQGDPVKGFGTATRNSIAPWKCLLGRARTGGSLVDLSERPLDEGMD